jgi:Pectate lyase superfamily protein
LGAVEVFGNQPATTVTSGGTTAPAAGTIETWTVSAVSTFPTASATATPPTQFHVGDVLSTASSEIIAVTATSGTTWTVTRGAENTTPVAHAAGFKVTQIITAGALTQAARTDWLNTVTMFGADPTGAADSTAAIQAAANAAPASGGVVYLPTGTYKVSTTITVARPGVYFLGDGLWNSIISYTGSGACLRMYSTAAYTPGAVGTAGGAGGGFLGIMVDGVNAQAGAYGVHVGDIYQLKFELGVRRFTGAGSIGAWLDNNYYWAEQMYGRIWAEECSTHVQFDSSVNTSGSATGSFIRLALDIMLDGKGKGNLVIMANGATVEGGRVGIYGNTDYGASTYYVLTLTGSNATSGYSRFQDCTLNIDVECNATSGTQPATINFASAGNNGIFRCIGNMNFAGQNAFANANNFATSFQYDGPVMGDSKLQRTTGLGMAPYEAGTVTNGTSLNTRYNSIVRATPSGAATGLIMQIGSGSGVGQAQTVTVINDGTGAMTFAAPATSHVADGAAVPIAPKTAATYVWDSDGTYWTRAGGPQTPANMLLVAPSGATGETFAREEATQYTTQSSGYSPLVSGTVYAAAIPLPANLLISNLTLQVGSSAFTVVTHGWYALLDSGLVVRAVTADQSGGNWTNTFTPVTLSVSASAYTTTYTGYYYVAFCATFSSAGIFPAKTAPVGGLAALTPVLAGSSSTGQTTPPSTGTALAALTSAAGGRFYAYTS